MFLAVKYRIFINGDANRRKEGRTRDIGIDYKKSGRGCVLSHEERMTWYLMFCWIHSSSSGLRFLFLKMLLSLLFVSNETDDILLTWGVKSGTIIMGSTVVRGICINLEEHFCQRDHFIFFNFFLHPECASQEEMREEREECQRQRENLSKTFSRSHTKDDEKRSTYRIRSIIWSPKSL